MAQVQEPKVRSKTLKLREGSVVVYRKPKRMEEKDFDKFLQLAADDFLARFGISAVVVGVEEWKELQILDDKIMEHYGWVRKDRVFMMKEDVKILQTVDGSKDEEE